MTAPRFRLQLKGVTKRFGGLVAVNEVDLDVREGEICAVIGPNGAGKSTLFGTIAGDVRASAGRILLDGIDLAGKRSHQIASLGVSRSFQLVNLFSTMTVAENVMVGAERHASVAFLESATHLGSYRRLRDEACARAKGAMRVVGIAHLAEKPVGRLTYGQQRLVAAARALAANPRLLLLDEPAAGLSEGEVESLGGAIRRARELGATVLLVEHNVPFVMSVCEHVAVLHFGKVIADGTPADVRNSQAVIEAYLGR